MNPACNIRWWGRAAAGCLPVLAMLLSISWLSAASDPLTVLSYRVLGVQLQVTPAAVSVPKNIPGSVMVQIADAAGNTNVAPELAEGAYVEALFRGPSFPARKLVGRVNEALLLPPLNLVGEYQLDDVRLVDAATGRVRLEGTPRSVPVRVFDEVLISRVTSRPLSLDEIQQRGIVIDQANFRVVEFEVGFVLDGRKIPVKFPVVAPGYGAVNQDIIPVAEMQARLVEAQRINDQLAAESVEQAKLPPELQAPRLNIQIKGVNFQVAPKEEQQGLNLPIPPIPALMVIPGNIGYLNQFFSVQIFTENGAPQGSGLNVHNVRARLILPPGPDQIVSTNYSQPGDDPLRFARVGAAAEILDELTIVGPEPVRSTRFNPGEGGSAEFLVEGLQEGLHVMDLDLTADLDGLAAGTVQIAGKAAGSVLVRNPKFSMAFTHPKGVSFGEPYTASVTLLNTGETEANLVHVTLKQGSLSGGKLESPETVQLGTIKPGESRTATYRVRAQRTGRIRFSNLTTSEDSVLGRFRLEMAVDERGVDLSPDSLVMPEYTEELPVAVLDAARRVLGQGLSVATAGRLPTGVMPVGRGVLATRVLELAEAGQRVRYGESLARVLPDVALDWQAARVWDAGFDQIIRETDAGGEWREALMMAMEAVSVTNDAVVRLAGRAADLAGRGEAWVISSSSASALELEIRESDLEVRLDKSELARSAGYRGTNGHWLAGKATNGVMRWTATVEVNSAEVALLTLTTNGNGRWLRWTVSGVPAGGCLSYDLGEGGLGLALDADCDGTAESTLAGVLTQVVELPPELLTVFQETKVTFLRPWPSCYGNEAQNYGHLLAVLFSKPMTQENLEVLAAYRLDNGTPAAGVQIQQGNRVALVAMREPLSAIIPRKLTVDGVTDVRGNAVVSVPEPIRTTFREGVAARGRVLRADGSPAAGVPVTLTMHDLYQGPFECVRMTPTTAQKFTDSQGFFELDFIFGAVPFTVSAVDTAGVPFELVTNILQSFEGDVFNKARFLSSLVSSNLAAAGNRTSAEAVALAEGLDRAIWRDLIDLSGGRAGGTNVIGLRFRGRGTVVGQVLAADGSTPVAGAAVNLYPDPSSREQGRGVFSDAEGRFQFNGVPLGSVTVTVRTGRGHYRTVADTVDRPFEVRELQVVLTAPTVAETVRDDLRGRVLEADGVVASAGARVYVTGGYGAAAVVADEAGYWEAKALPEGEYRVVAVSQDGQRKGNGSGAVVAGQAGYVNVTLGGMGRVTGRVETSAGLPVANAVVAGGRSIVRTDANGMFVLEDIPEGSRGISAGWEAADAPGGFPRLTSGGVNVLPGLESFVVLRFSPVGQIIGQVRDANGGVVPNIRVAIPFPEGFAWVDADDQGRFKFINMGVGRNYIVSAPSPPVEEEQDEAKKLLRDAGVAAGPDESDAMVLATVAAVLSYNQRLDGGGKAATSPTGGFGWTETALTFDGETAVVNLSLLPYGKVSGVVMNHQGTPIGARVRLTGMLRAANGEPEFGIVGNRDSDAATGEFTLNGLLAGNWGMQAASPFYPVVVTRDGRTTKEALDVTNLVMQFPPINEVNGRLTGRVLLPDGTPAGEDVAVQISFGPDYVIRTDETGFFDTQLKLPATTYRVEARDPATGLRGEVQASVRAGVTNYAEVTMLGRGSARVQVLDAFGQPAAGVAVQLKKQGYPGGEFGGLTDAGGGVGLDELFEGNYAVHVSINAGTAKLEARGSVNVGVGATNSLVLRLGGTGNLRGVFVARESGEAIAFGRVDVGTVASVPTDDQGRFEVTGLGMGSYRVLGVDAVSGRVGLATATLTYPGQVVDLTVRELALGEVSGQVFEGGKAVPVAGARVTLTERVGINPGRTVTTGPDGVYRFPGVLPGVFDVSAQGPNNGKSAQGSGLMGDAGGMLELNLTFPADEALGQVEVFVVDTDGVTPATNATVSLSGRPAPVGVDGMGRVLFTELRLGPVEVRAQSGVAAESSSVGRTNAPLSAVATNVTVTVRLSGVGGLKGRVLGSDGTTPVLGAEVDYQVTGDSITRGGRLLTDGGGRFAVGNLPLGSYSVKARSAALATADAGTLAAPGQTNELTLVLGSSGSVTGRVVRADGTTVVAGNEITLQFNAPSGLDGLFVEETDADGGFRFDGVPVGPLKLQSVLSAWNGLVFTNTVLSTNGQLLEVGVLRLDEDWPRVVSVSPAPNATGVSIGTGVELVFSEPLRNGSFDTGGVYIASGGVAVPATLQLRTNAAGMSNVIRLLPVAPLRSQATYTVVAVDGERVNAVGTVVGRGPKDLVGRLMLQSFTSTFTTRDDDPPQLVSVSPTNGQVQVDPRAVIRLSFNEPIRETGYVLTVTGPGGPVAGTATVGFNGLALVFTPAEALPVNAAFTVTVSGVADLAGNALPGQPLATSFETLDTRGPEITALRLAGGAPPVAGNRVELEAVLGQVEPGVSVSFTANLDSIGLSTNAPFRVPVTLPTSGFVIYRATARDGFGNDGAFKELRVDVVPNTAPVVTLTALGAATNGVVGSGQAFQLRLTASDETAVTNVSLVATGALTAVRTFTNAVSTNLSFIVPAGAQAGSVLGVRAQALDSLGVPSAEARLTLAVTDRTAPTLAIVSPTNGAFLDPRQPLVVQVQSLDNSTNLVLSAVLSGGASSTQAVAIPLSAGLTKITPVTVAMPSAPSNGGQVTLTLTASDGASNLVSVVRTWSLLDVRAPQLLSVTPTNEAVRQPLWLGSVIYVFNDTLQAASVTTNQVRLLGPDGESVPLTFGSSGPSGGSYLLYASLAQTLRPGARYTNVLGPALADAAGNRWTDTNGVAPPDGGLTNVFTTARFLTVEPAAGTPVLGGTNFQARVTYEAGIGAGVFRFTLGSRTPVVVGVNSTSTNVVATLPVELDPNPASLTLKIEADSNGSWSRPYVVTNVVLAFGGNATTNQRPVVTLTRTAPQQGPLASGMTFSLRLSATDDYVVTNLTFSGSGVIATNALFGNGAARNFTFKVPTDAAGASQSFAAWAVDDVGATSVVATLVLPVLPAVASIGTNEIVYSRFGQPDGAVYVAAADGSGERQITVGEQPRLSPNGRYVAFKRDGQLNQGSTYYMFANVYVRDLTTGDEWLAFANGNYITSYGWRPDSSALVLHYGYSFYEIKPDGTPALELYRGNFYDDAPSVNPVDGRLAFENQSSGMGITVSGAVPAATNIVKVPGTKPGQQSPVWSPDGEWIAFLDSTDNWNLWKVRPDGSGLTRLTTLSGTNIVRGQGAWISDSTQLVVPANVNGTNGLFLAKADGSGLGLLRASVGAADYDFVGSIRMGYEPGPVGRLAGSIPTGGAVRVSPWLATNRVEFTRSVQESGVLGNVEFTNNAGLAVPYAVRADGTRVWVETALPLEPGVTYTRRVLPGLRDRAGRALLTESGQPIPAQGVEYAFTTADLLTVSPAGGSTFEAGAFITATVTFEAGLGADFFRFVVGNGVPKDVPVEAADTVASAKLALPFTGATTALQISAHKDGQDPYGLAPLTLNLTPPAGAPIQFLVADTIELTEGTVSNVVFQVNSSAGPLEFIDFDPGVATPAFAGLSNVVFNLVDTNGVAEAMLTLQPRAADAGSYVVGLRARTTSGVLLTTNIVVTVLDDPGLLVTRWKAPASGNWSVATNWTDGLPSTTREAVIDVAGDYTLTVNSGQTMGYLTMGAASGTQTLLLSGGTMNVEGLAQLRTNAVWQISGGTLGGAGEVRITGRAEWNSGSMSGTGRTVVSPGATLRLRSSGSHAQYRTLENRGTVEWLDDGGWYLVSAQIQNRPGAVLDWIGSGGFSYGGGNASVLNEGLLRKSGTTTNTFGVYLDNRAQVELQGGQVVFSGSGTNSNSLVVAPGASAVFNNQWTFATNSVLRSSDSGSVRFTGGTMTVNTPLELVGSVPIQNSTVNFNADQTFADLFLLNGTLGGSGTLTVTNLLEWTSGALNSGGPVVIAPGATLRLRSSGSHTQYRTLENRGTVEWLDDGGWYLVSAQILNRPGAVLDWIGSGGFGWGGGNISVLNEGLLRKSGTSTNTFGVYLDNRAQVELQGGQVVFSGSGTNSNSLVVAPGASAVFNNQWTFATNSVLRSSDSGSVRFTGGTMTVNTPLELVGSVPIQNSTVNFNADQTFADLFLLNGTLGGSGTLTVTNLLEWTSGALNSGGPVVIAPGATLRLRSSGSHAQYRTLENRGTVEWLDDGGWYLVSAQILNRPGAVFDWIGSGGFSYGGGNISVLNQGLFRKSGTATNTFGIYLENQGDFTVDAGRVDLTGGGMNSGAITVAAGAELRMASTFTYDPAGSVTGMGVVTFSSGTHNVQGTFDPQSTPRMLGGNVTISTPLNLTTPLVLSGVTLNLNSDQTFGAVILEPNAILSGSGTITVGTLTWNGGTMSGTGRTVIPETGTMQIASASAFYLQRMLENRGTLDWVGAGDLYLMAPLWNTATGTVLQKERGRLAYNGGSAVITNAGQWNKSYEGTNEIYAQFVNQAPLVLTNGVLRFNWGGVLDAPLEVQAPAEVRFEAGFTHTTNSALTGTGTIVFLSGAHDLRGVFDPQGPVWFNGGTVTTKDVILPDGFLAITNNATVNFNTNQTFATIRQQGTIGGSGDVAVAGDHVWLGGYVAGTGVLDAPAGATIWVTNSSDPTRYLARPVHLGGRMVLTNGGNVYLSAPLWIKPGGQVEWTGNGGLNYNGGTPAVTNDGALVRFGVGSTNQIYAPWTHRGSVAIQDGGLRSSWGGVYSGSFDVSAASVLLFSSGTHVFTNGVSFSGDGTVRFQSGLQQGAPLNMGALQVWFENSASVTGSNLLSNAAGGSITFNGSMTFPGSMNIGGALSLNASNISVTINGALTLQPGATLVNPGNLQVRAFNNLGGTIVGNAPVLFGGIPAPFGIESIQLESGSTGSGGPGLQHAMVNQPAAVVLRWSGPAGTVFALEGSSDLVNWNDLEPGWVVEPTPGQYEARPPAKGNNQFYRVRWVLPGSTSPALPAEQFELDGEEVSASEREHLPPPRELR